MIQFLIVLFIAPAPAPKLTNDIAVGAVVPVFVMVRFLEVVPLLDPSMVIKSPPFILISAPDANEPLIVAVTPVAGLIVNVLLALPPVIAFIVKGYISDPLITVAPPDNAVVGAVETTNVVAFVMLATVVFAANTPVPAVTVTTIPGVRLVVLPTVIVVPEEIAPAAEV